MTPAKGSTFEEEALMLRVRLALVITTLGALWVAAGAPIDNF
jgi:hypothetical protein